MTRLTTNTNTNTTQCFLCDGRGYLLPRGTICSCQYKGTYVTTNTTTEKRPVASKEQLISKEIETIREHLNTIEKLIKGQE